MSLNISNKIVLITGASSGIGKATAYHFAKHNCHLILAARRHDKIAALTTELQQKFQISVLPLQLDVRNKDQVISILNNLPEGWANIDILVNNAGLALDSLNLQDGNIDNWDTMIDTNLRGLLYVTRTLLPKMVARNSGHIINIGSIAGQECYPLGNVYAATKHAVAAITKSMRLDLLGTAIRVTEIAPGAVHTEFSAVRWHDQQRADNFYHSFTPLEADDIADAIVYCATRPLHVDISLMTIYSTAQASANHLHKADTPTRSVSDR